MFKNLTVALVSHNSNSEMDDNTFFQSVFEFLEHKPVPVPSGNPLVAALMAELDKAFPKAEPKLYELPASSIHLDFKELHEYVERTPLPTVSRSHWDAEMEALAAERAKVNWARILREPLSLSPVVTGPIEKEMPEVLQSLIQDFARPLCRGDWRTCKRDESRAIYLCQRDKRHAVADFIGGPEFWDIVVAQSFYELLKNYPPGPGSDEGQTTIQLRRVWV